MLIIVNSLVFSVTVVNFKRLLAAKQLQVAYKLNGRLNLFLKQFDLKKVKILRYF